MSSLYLYSENSINKLTASRKLRMYQVNVINNYGINIYYKYQIQDELGNIKNYNSIEEFQRYLDEYLFASSHNPQFKFLTIKTKDLPFIKITKKHLNSRDTRQSIIVLFIDRLNIINKYE